jgi:hypothetical protein
VRIPPRMGLFLSQFMQIRAGMFAPWLAEMSFFKYNLIVVKVAFLPVVRVHSSSVELDLTHSKQKLH